MINNVLKSDDIRKIVLKYFYNKSYYEYTVKLHFVDQADCYLSTEFTPDYEKLTKTVNAELLVYTPRGIFSSKVKIHETSATLKEVTFTIFTPQEWTTIQNRNGKRVPMGLSSVLEFNDGFKIDAITEDVAPNGISFYYPNVLKDKYKQEICKITVQFPDGTFGKNTSGTLIRDAKFLREKIIYKGGSTKFLYVFKYTNLKIIEREYLKQFLNGIKQQTK